MTIYATPDRDGSDVTVIRAGGGLICNQCKLLPRHPDPHGGRSAHLMAHQTFEAEDIPTMLDHLDLHQILGHVVPPSAFLRLRTEHADNFEKGPR